MRLLYPSSHEIHRLSDSQLLVKIARHSACSVCKSCTGLHPLPGIVVVSDDDIEASSSLLRDLTQYGSDDDDGSAYLQSCACGHSAPEHNAELSDLSRDEFIRRGLVGIRLDELLQVSPCVSKKQPSILYPLLIGMRERSLATGVLTMSLGQGQTSGLQLCGRGYHFLEEANVSSQISR